MNVEHIKMRGEMAKFKVTWIESYEHTVVVEANSYLEAEEKADQMLTKDSKSYCASSPSWHLHTNQLLKPEKIPGKNVFAAA